MASIYTGDPTTVTNVLSRTVSGATNATPIVITTTVDHGFATHDVVEVADVGGNTAANGTWVITKLSATTFSLNGSAGNADYTSGGTVVDQSLTPQFQIPSDGDGPFIKAADVNAAFEALADRTQFLAAQVRVPAGNTIVRRVAPFPYATSVLNETRDKGSNFIADSISGASDIRTFMTNGAVRFPNLPSGAEAFGILRNITNDLIDGATLASVSALVEASVHAALPSTPMSFGVFRLSFASTFTSLRSAGDFVTDSSPDVSSYGSAHGIDITCDQNNVIDKAQYSYWIQFWNEFGTNDETGNKLFGFTLTMTGLSAVGIP